VVNLGGDNPPPLTRIDTDISSYIVAKTSCSSVVIRKRAYYGAIETRLAYYFYGNTIIATPHKPPSIGTAPDLEIIVRHGVFRYSGAERKRHLCKDRSDPTSRRPRCRLALALGRLPRRRGAPGYRNFLIGPSAKEMLGQLRASTKRAARNLAWVTSLKAPYSNDECGA